MSGQRVTGDLIEMAVQGHFDVIVHGCNCFHTMGAGIAKAIAAEFPEALEADRATLKGDRAKLGTYSYKTVSRNGRLLTVVNAYTQFDWRGSGKKVDYPAVSSCFKRIASDFSGQRIGYPLIGAGLAGGDWAIISELIDVALEGQTHCLVVLPTA